MLSTPLRLEESISETWSEVHERVSMVDGFVAAYRQYCWDVDGIEDLKLAPFQILAGEGEVYALRVHRWHLDLLGRLCATDPDDLPPHAFDARRCQ